MGVLPLSHNVTYKSWTVVEQGRFACSVNGAQRGNFAVILLEQSTALGGGAIGPTLFSAP